MTSASKVMLLSPTWWLYVIFYHNVQGATLNQPTKDVCMLLSLSAHRRNRPKKRQYESCSKRTFGKSRKTLRPSHSTVIRHGRLALTRITIAFAAQAIVACITRHDVSTQPVDFQLDVLRRSTELRCATEKFLRSLLLIDHVTANLSRSYRIKWLSTEDGTALVLLLSPLDIRWEKMAEWWEQRKWDAPPLVSTCFNSLLAAWRPSYHHLRATINSPPTQPRCP